jgi:hypothetical protein
MSDIWNKDITQLGQMQCNSQKVVPETQDDGEDTKATMMSKIMKCKEVGNDIPTVIIMTFLALKKQPMLKNHCLKDELYKSSLSDDDCMAFARKQDNLLGC